MKSYLLQIIKPFNNVFGSKIFEAALGYLRTQQMTSHNVHSLDMANHGRFFRFWTTRLWTVKSEVL